jgi:hypothetical protein
MHGAGSPNGPGRTARRGCRRLALCQGRTTDYGPPSALVANPKKSVRRSWPESGFFILAVLDKEGLYQGGYLGRNRPDGPIAQLDRVTDFYSVGCRFESCWDRQAFGDRRARLGTASSQMAESLARMSKATSGVPLPASRSAHAGQRLQSWRDHSERRMTIPFMSYE